MRQLHRRSFVRGGHTTIPEHMLPTHQKHAEWTPSRMIGWAIALASAFCGSNATTVIPASKTCARAMAIGGRAYRQVESILRNGLDRLPLPGHEPEDKGSWFRADLLRAMDGLDIVAVGAKSELRRCLANEPADWR